ncbi:MAG TPA: hypothetical protein VN083_03525, partial [Vicinamibacteria bacterium]|nr:hypothetical protein [Vicinamibacteria bacterium]
RVRYGSFVNLDLRLAKEVKIAGNVAANLTVDLFNVFNTNTVLQENRNLGASGFGQILELPNPRILRFGIRLGF